MSRLPRLHGEYRQVASRSSRSPTQVALRFEIGRDEAAGEKTMSRLLDRFAWIPGSIAHCTGPLMCVASLTHARPVNANVRPHIHLEDKTT